MERYKRMYTGWLTLITLEILMRKLHAVFRGLALQSCTNVHHASLKNFRWTGSVYFLLFHLFWRVPGFWENFNLMTYSDENR